MNYEELFEPVAELGKLLKKDDGPWRDDSVHFLLLALEERAVHVAKALEVPILQYCGFFHLALRCPRIQDDEDFIARVRERVLFDLMQALVVIPTRGFGPKKKIALVAKVGRCFALAESLPDRSPTRFTPAHERPQ